MRKKHSGGFTLVEVSVSMAILAIAMGATISIFLMVFNLFGHGASENEVKQLGDDIYRHLSRRLTYCTHLQVLPQDSDIPHAYASEYTVDADTGHLSYKTGDDPAYDFYGDEWYKKCTVQLLVTARADGRVELQVQVLQDGKVAYRTASTIELINITLAGTAPEGVLDTPLTDPYLILDDTEIISDKVKTPVPSQMKEYVLTAFSDFQKDKAEYNAMAWNDPRKAQKKQEIMDKYGVSNVASFSNDQMRDYVRSTYYGGTWPDIDLGLERFSVENTNKLNPYVKGDLKDIAPLELQFHAANVPGTNDPDKMSIVIYAVQKGPANSNNHSMWRPLVVYDPYDSYWYAPFPTTGGTKLGTYKDANVATPRPDDKAYYDNLTELWNPLK